MKNVCTLSSPNHHFTDRPSGKPMDIIAKRCSTEKDNPWKSPELKELGWSEFMKRKAEEALKSINGIFSVPENLVCLKI